ncbi:MAG: ATP-binding protein [Deltaproteobacteria bacterium]|nr:ATP-binding protein [Deltaproteobacteria bacterium]
MFLDWEKIFNGLADGLLVLDAARSVVHGNTVAARLAESDPQEIVGVPFEKLFGEKPLVREMIQKLLGEMRPGTIRDLSWIDSSANPLFFDIQVSPLWDDHETFLGWTVTFQDTSALKKMEEQKRKVDRLAQMGTIAAGLAHEIRNPLSGIKGAAQLIAREPGRPELKEWSELILKESERVNRLLTDLLDFSSPKSFSLEALNINQLLDLILVLQEEQLRSQKITLMREYDPSLPPILGNSDRLTQAFLNFIKNAIEAMPEGGRLRVASRMVSDYRIRRGDQGSSQMASVEVQDTGVGIPVEDLDKIFTPFFTTKSRGSGLGLALAQKIVHEQEGTVQVKSQVAVGTTVSVFLRLS